MLPAIKASSQPSVASGSYRARGMEKERKESRLDGGEPPGRVNGRSFGPIFRDVRVETNVPGPRRD